MQSNPMHIDPDAVPAPELSNPVLDCIERRTSTRSFSDEPVTLAERQAILHAAGRAPSAGAMMFYSIISVDDRSVRSELCHLCDDQPFMLKAPFWLLFVADTRKWYDMYRQAGCYDDPSLAQFAEHARRAPGLGDLLLACEDTMCAAQTAVIAAESLGIGSCYIGDCIEHGEQVAELLGLPAGTLPLALLVFGHERGPRTGEVSVSCLVDDIPGSSGTVGEVEPLANEPAASPVASLQGVSGAAKKGRMPTPHPMQNLFMSERYRIPTPEERESALRELDAKFTPHAVAAGAPTGERVRKLYHRKHTSDFIAEMNRSAAWWYKRWCSCTWDGSGEDDDMKA